MEPSQHPLTGCLFHYLIFCRLSHEWLCGCRLSKYQHSSPLLKGHVQSCIWDKFCSNWYRLAHIEVILWQPSTARSHLVSFLWSPEGASGTLLIFSSSTNTVLRFLLPNTLQLLLFLHLYFQNFSLTPSVSSWTGVVSSLFHM